MEKPVTLKVPKGKSKKKSSSQSVSTGNKTCIIHCTETRGQDITNLGQQGFQKIKVVAKLRLAKSDPVYKLESISQNVSDVFDESIHGIHREC